MQTKSYRTSSTPLRIAGAAFFFVSAIIGFESGVTVSERPEIVDASLLEKAYYSLGLFVLGGMDLGTPQDGPLLGRMLLWSAYFGAPILAAWTVLSALVKALNPQGWFLRRLRNHVVIVGESDIAVSILRSVRRRNRKVPIVVVSNSSDQVLLEELQQSYGAIVVSGGITHEFFLDQLHISQASKIFLLDNNSLRNYEAAAALLVEAALVDGVYANLESDMIAELLVTSFNMDAERADSVLKKGESLAENAVDAHALTRHVKTLPEAERVAIIEGLYRVSLADGGG